MSFHYSKPSSDFSCYSVIEALTMAYQALYYLAFKNVSNLIFFYSSVIRLTPGPQSLGCFLTHKIYLGPLHLLIPFHRMLFLEISTWQLLHFIQILIQKSPAQEGLPWPSCLKHQHLVWYFPFPPLLLLCTGEQGFLYALFIVVSQNLE